MEIIDTHTPFDAPICERHNWKGGGCPMCVSDERESNAKLMAVAFISWQMSNAFFSMGGWHYHLGEEDYQLISTTEELYDIFIQEINK